MKMITKIILKNIIENSIICEYDIKKEKLNKFIQIINCLDKRKKKLIEERVFKQGITDLKMEINEKK